MPKVVVPVSEEVLQAAERRKAAGTDREISQFLGEMIDLGLEYRFQQLHQQFEVGEISLAYFSRELGLGVRDLYSALEKRGLPTSNIGTELISG